LGGNEKNADGTVNRLFFILIFASQGSAPWLI